MSTKLFVQTTLILTILCFLITSMVASFNIASEYNWNAIGWLVFIFTNYLATVVVAKLTDSSISILITKGVL